MILQLLLVHLGPASFVIGVPWIFAVDLLFGGQDGDRAEVGLLVHLGLAGFVIGVLRIFAVDLLLRGELDRHSIGCCEGRRVGGKERPSATAMAVMLRIGCFFIGSIRMAGADSVSVRLGIFGFRAVP